MLLGHFVVRQVTDRKPLLLQRRHDLAGIAAPRNLHADEDVRGVRVGNAVVEFRHAALPDHAAEAAKAAAFLGYGHGEHRFARLAHFGAVGHETQAVEIHVGA
ncbi:hypothetical protein D3C71_1567290 [compost metagenome]